MKPLWGGPYSPHKKHNLNARQLSSGGHGSAVSLPEYYHWEEDTAVPFPTRILSLGGGHGSAVSLPEYYHFSLGGGHGSAVSLPEYYHFSLGGGHGSAVSLLTND